MIREIPSGVRRELERQESPEFLLYFLTITHKILSEPIRVVSDPVNFTVDGNEFIGYEFDIRILDDSEGMPFAELTIQNIDRRIGEALLKATEQARLQIDVIAGSQFDLTVNPRTQIDSPIEYVYQAKHLRLVNVKGGLISLTGRIISWDYTQELYPGLRATQDRFPGLFR